MTPRLFEIFRTPKAMRIYHLEFDGSRSGGSEVLRTEGKDVVKQAAFVILSQKYNKNYPHDPPPPSTVYPLGQSQFFH